MQKSKGKGFTVAELLVVVAIIGVLVAVSIPIFTGQLRRARVATNKANIRAARAAGIAKYYDDEITGVFYKKGINNTRPRAYYYYDTASGKITGQQYYYESHDKNWDYKSDSTKCGEAAYKIAQKYDVCTYIIIYVSPTDNETGATLQTSPYYTDKSGNEPDYNKNESNPFGPIPGDDKNS